MLFRSRGSDRFIDALIAWGSQLRIDEHYQAQEDAGVDQMIIIPIGIDLKAEAGWQRLAAQISQ